MDKHFYPGTKMTLVFPIVGALDGEFSVVRFDGEKVILKSDKRGTELPVTAEELIWSLERGYSEFVLDDFTKGYLVCALWAESDQDDNAERDAREEGYTVEQVEEKYAVFLNGERVDEKLFEYAGSEEGAWWHAYKLSGGGSCPDSALENNYGIEDFAPSALKDIIQDCLDFQAGQKELLEQAYAGAYTDLRARGHGDTTVEEFAGHDFWLTRNGHGCGFWDRGLDEVGDKLSEACKPYGSSNVYVGDDKKLYVQ